MKGSHAVAGEREELVQKEEDTETIYSKGKAHTQQGAAGNNSSSEHREAARGGSGTIENTHKTEQYKT